MVKGFAIFSMLAVAAAMTAGCEHSAATAPPLTGPSQLAMAVTVTANPDRISLDGASQALITAQVRGPNGQVEVNVPLRVDMVVTTSNGPSVQDYGTLSARNIVTGPDGNALAVYTAPALAAGANQPFSSVSIQVIIVGSNAVAAVTHDVAIALVPAGVILPPADTPTASFVVTPTPVSLNLAASFDASGSCPGAKNSVGCLPSSSAVITNYAWTFGDGSTANGKTVNHTYSGIGTFNATLTITNDRGIQNSTTQAIVVGATTPPTAAFVYSPAAPSVGQAVSFNASQSAAAQGRTITSYGWNFGDGATAGGVNVSHAYAAAGTFTVLLTVTDDVGQTATASQTINPGTATGPSANFTFSPALPGRFDQVVFDASSSSTAQGQTIVDVAWNFGDDTPVIHCPGGGAASCPGPTNRISAHSFATAQTFVVNLVETDSAGRIGSHSTTVTIAVADPTAIIGTPSPTSPAPGTTVFFSSNATTYYPGSGPASFAWTFGDGGVSALANPTHAYLAVGTYTVGLAVTDNKGRTGIAPTVSVTVALATPPVAPASPVAAFSSSPPSPSLLAGGRVFFDASTSSTPSGAAINLYRWNFGDGTIISGPPAGGVPFPGAGTYQVPQHVYVAAGSYTVTLTVTDTNNLSGSTTGTVAVGP